MAASLQPHVPACLQGGEATGRQWAVGAARRMSLTPLPCLPACLQVDPRPVTHDFFADRSEFISAELSRQIVNGLHKIGMIDYQGYVTADPRQTKQVWGGWVERLGGVGWGWIKRGWWCSGLHVLHAAHSALLAPSVLPSSVASPQQCICAARTHPPPARPPAAALEGATGSNHPRPAPRGWQHRPAAGQR
jgi:hypothetical protein